MYVIQEGDASGRRGAALDRGPGRPAGVGQLRRTWVRSGRPGGGRWRPDSDQLPHRGAHGVRHCGAQGGSGRRRRDCDPRPTPGWRWIPRDGSMPWRPAAREPGSSMCFGRISPRYGRYRWGSAPPRRCSLGCRRPVPKRLTSRRMSCQSEPELLPRLHSLMPLVSTPAIVLSTLRYSETSKIVRLATREHGVQSVIAKGALAPEKPLRRRPSAPERRAGTVPAQGEPGAPPAHRLRSEPAARRTRRPSWSAMPSPARWREVMLRFAPPDPHPESFDLLQHALEELEIAPLPTVEALGLPSALADGERPRLRALARCLRHRRDTATRSVGRSPSAPGKVAHSVPDCAALHGATQLPEQARADLAALMDSDATAAGAGARSMARPTAGCWPATSAITWPRVPSFRRSSSGLSVPG